MTSSRSYVRDTLLGRLEAFAPLDRAIEPVQAAVRELLPDQSSVKEGLSGTWLGHPLHPLLTDVVVGAWGSAFVLDLLGGYEREDAAADLLLTGVLAALPTAAAGISDWADLEGARGRVGAAHATGSSVALALNAASWAARRRGRRGLGKWLSGLAMGSLGLAAWLGGHLSFGEGVGVDQTVFEDPPTAWTPVVDDESLKPGEPIRRSARGTGVLLIRHRSKIHALLDRCSHRGCSLAEGSFDGSAITCPCHGSRFALDGALLAGPATAPQPILETRVRKGRIEVRAQTADPD